MYDVNGAMRVVMDAWPGYSVHVSYGVWHYAHRPEEFVAESEWCVYVSVQGDGAFRQHYRHRTLVGAVAAALADAPAVDLAELAQHASDDWAPDTRVRIAE
jgi:hypothetical protein